MNEAEIGVQQKVYVLRLGHRIERDRRATMHVFLAARALSALGAVYSGQRDRYLEERIKAVVNSWGGPFEVEFLENWIKLVREWKNRGIVCHLTMYGIDIEDCLNRIPKDREVLVIVGSQKVPRTVFQLADLNISVGNQPHSEIAALTVFLDRLFQGKGLKREFLNAKLKVIPQQAGKKVLCKS